MRHLLITLFLSTLSAPFFAQSITKHTEALDGLLEQTESYFVMRDQLEPSVSGASIGWHSYHLLLVTTNIYEALASSDPNAYRYRPNFLRGIVFTTGNIPRGKGKAPESALPPEQISLEALEAQLAQVRAILDKLEQLPPKSSFEHPVFGTLKRDQAIKFIVIHTRHHLKIIRDIDATAVL